jgi:hypothetical protein
VPAEADTDLVAPPLPVRASIYIAPDGTVHFGALFAELVPVAAALGRTATATTLGGSESDSSRAATPSSTISSPSTAG